MGYALDTYPGLLILIFNLRRVDTCIPYAWSGLDTTQNTVEELNEQRGAEELDGRRGAEQDDGELNRRRCGAEQDDGELERRWRGAEELNEGRGAEELDERHGVGEIDGELDAVQRRMIGCSTSGAEELDDGRTTGGAEGHRRRRFSESCPCRCVAAGGRDHGAKGK
jgi:hypothetical protein